MELSLPYEFVALNCHEALYLRMAQPPTSKSIVKIPT